MAKSFKPACLQPQELDPTFGASFDQDEDCLYLNVWTPQVSSNYRAPVVIFFEGEGFVTGYPGRFPAQDLAAEGVVVVSASYRLNVFGFLTFENEEARGNVGLLDQYLVMVWVRDNIDAFGGNPRSVTLMGHSAGAVSIMHHLASPRTKGLFRSAILMSGSITSPLASSGSSSNASREIAKSLGCLRTFPHSTISCLRSKSSIEILKAFESQYKNGNWSDLPLPVSDGYLPETEEYLHIDTKIALESGSINRVPILTGITSHDGTVALARWEELIQLGYDHLRHVFQTSFIPTAINRYNFTLDPSEREKIAAIIKWQYLSGLNDSRSLMPSLINFFTDSQFLAPHKKQLELLAAANFEIYSYVFEYSGVNFHKTNVNISGSGHGTELLFLFGPTLMQRNSEMRFTRAEEKLSAGIKRLWIDFISKGSISPNPYGYGTSWRPYNIREDNYVVFRLGNDLVPSQGVMRDPDRNDEYYMVNQRARLWNSLLPLLPTMMKSPKETSLGAPKGMQLTKDLPYRNAMFILLGFVIILLGLLVVCVILLKKQFKERDREIF